MRPVALVAFLTGVLAVAAASASTRLPATRTAVATPRILYSSDWSGTFQLYAADPSGRAATGQLTFGRAPACVDNPQAECGFRDPTPSPDGRRILFWDFVTQGPYLRRSLFVANADGTGRRRVAVTAGSVVGADWAPDSKRLAYYGNTGIHVVGASGSGDRLVPTSHPGDRSPEWSPDGRSIAFVDDSLHDLVVVSGRTRVVAVRDERIGTFGWSPTGTWIAFSSPSRNGVFLVHPDRPGRRRAGTGSDFAWAPDGNSIAVDGVGVRVYGLRSRRSRTITTVGDSHGDLVWSPNGRRLAMDRGAGIMIADPKSGATRVVTRDHARGLAWAPDSRSLAFVDDTYTLARGAHDLRIVELGGGARNVVPAAAPYGGSVGGFAWMTPPAAARYRKPAGRSIATVTAAEVTASSPITRLAAEGGRVAYVSCGHLFLWTPASARVQQAEKSWSLSPWCSTPTNYDSYSIYGLAVTRDRVAYGSVSGGNTRAWWLGWVKTGARDTLPLECDLGAGYATNGGPFRPTGGELVGELAGSGDALFYSAWNESGPFGGIVTTSQWIRAADSSGCPGSDLVDSSGGPLVPLDADGGRVVAAGDNETWVLDGMGSLLTRVPDPLVAAQLSGTDLVVLRRGQLRHYDAATGRLLHIWPLPDVASGRECASPNLFRCAEKPRLILEDAARGLVTYVLDGKVHVLRLADGADAVVADGMLSRFMDAGLVYADGSRLRVAPFDALGLP